MKQALIPRREDVASSSFVQVSARGTMLWVQVAVVLVASVFARSEEPSEVFVVMYEWSKLDFMWPDDSFKARFLDSSQYIPENTTISGVKVWRDKLYLTLPRWRKGVPATLTSIPHPNMKGTQDTSPKLEPFPSWEMQQVGNCTALQNVQNIEIHPNGQMWVIDSGRVNTMADRSDDRCPPKLVIFDLNTMSSSSSSGYASYDVEHNQGSGRAYGSQSGYNSQDNYGSQGNYEGRYNTGGYTPQGRGQGGYSNQDGYNQYGQTTPNGQTSYNPQGGSQGRYNSQDGYSQYGQTTPGSYSFQYSNSGAKIVRTYVFPEQVISRDSYLSDIVLDTSNGNYAYISDASEADPGIIVYSWKENKAWKVRDNRSMRSDPTVRRLNINGLYVTINKNIAGLALSPVSVSEDKRRVFYSPLSSYSLFSIPTSVLRDETRSSGDVSGEVKTLGHKTSISEGMAMDSNGVLYYGLLGENAITRWDTNLPFTENQHMIARDGNFLQWPASFGFDSENGNLTVVSNRLQNFLAGKVNINEANFRIITANTGTKSYLFSSSAGTYSTSTHMPTQMYDQGYNRDRDYNEPRDRMDHSEQHHISGGKVQYSAGERVLPGVLIFLLAAGKVVLA